MPYRGHRRAPKGSCLREINADLTPLFKGNPQVTPRPSNDSRKAGANPLSLEQPVQPLPTTGAFSQLRALMDLLDGSTTEGHGRMRKSSPRP
jgi:hypothetical protein